MHRGCLPLLAWPDVFTTLERTADLRVKWTVLDILGMDTILGHQDVGHVLQAARWDVRRANPPMKRPDARLAHARFSPPSFLGDARDHRRALTGMGARGRNGV